MHDMHELRGNREGLLRAREKTIEVLEEIRTELKAGMTEDDARKLALDIFARHGVKKHWHKPYIRFGAGTTMTFHQPLQPDYRLREHDPYYLDLGPVWEIDGMEYEGDYGDTFVFGTNSSAAVCAAVAQRLYSEARALWQAKGLDGKAIYAFLEKRAQELGHRLVPNVDGHRIGDFPHQKYTKERLAALADAPPSGLWVLEVMITDADGRYGAFFEDIL